MTRFLEGRYAQRVRQPYKAAVERDDRRDFRAMRPPHPRISGSGSYPTIYMSGGGPRYARSPKVLAQLARKTAQEDQAGGGVHRLLHRLTMPSC